MKVDFDSLIALGIQAKNLGLTHTVEAIKKDLLVAFDIALQVYTHAIFRDVSYTYPTQEMIDKYRNGNKLEAVKLYRESNGPGTLLASKVIIEAVGYQLGFAPQNKPAFDEVQFVNNSIIISSTNTNT